MSEENLYSQSSTPGSSQTLYGSDGQMKSIPPADYVIFKDTNDRPTAVYGDDKWDPNTARLSGRKLGQWRFDRLFHVVHGDAVQSEIKESLKYIVFCLLNYSVGGYAGALSVTTISTHFTLFKLAANFCYSQIDHPFIGKISLEQLFSNPAYLERFVKSLKNDRRSQGLLMALLLNLSKISPRLLGFTPVTDFSIFELSDKPKKNQFPILPTGLYLKLIDILQRELNHLEQFLPDLERFVAAFSDRAYGNSLDFQERALKFAPHQELPCFTEAVEWHYLTDLFIGDYACEYRQNLSMALAKIQYLLKYTIHTYTGMRDQEVVRLPYDCLRNEEIVPAILDSEGKQRRPPQTVDVISTTTKFTGYQASESWLAPTEVIRAVRVAQAICRGLSKIYGTPVEQMPLFSSPSIIKLPNKLLEPTSWMPENKPRCLQELVILPSHMEELQLSDPQREFRAGDGFAVGAAWPLTSHQLRRSLAYHGSSSGFISLPSLAKQFKHLARQMTKYYRNNFEKIKSIFGYYDPETNEYILPDNHFLFEFQMSVPMQAAYELISAVLSETELMGGTGVQINKQRQRWAAGDIIITDLRAETQKRAVAGEISYRTTFLGACTKVGDCQEYMLGNVLPCTTCDGSIIHPDSLNAHIASLEEERARYASDSGEYQVLTYEITSLQAFAKKGPKQ